MLFIYIVNRQHTKVCLFTWSICLLLFWYLLVVWLCCLLYDWNFNLLDILLLIGGTGFFSPKSWSPRSYCAKKMSREGDPKEHDLRGTPPDKVHQNEPWWTAAVCPCQWTEATQALATNGLRLVWSKWTLPARILSLHKPFLDAILVSEKKLWIFTGADGYIILNVRQMTGRNATIGIWKVLYLLVMFAKLYFALQRFFGNLTCFATIGDVIRTWKQLRGVKFPRQKCTYQSFKN